MKIAICDDDASFTENLAKYIRKRSAEIETTEIQVFVFHSGEDFLSAVESKNSFDIVFMDIEMGGMNGITVGNHLRNQSDCDDVVIIYISSHTSFSDALLDVGNVRFIKKPCSIEKLDFIFDRAIAQVHKYMERTPSKFVYTVHKDNLTVDTNRLVYLKGTGKLISIYIWDSTNKRIKYADKFYSSVSEAIKQLPQESFVRCARSLIVNLAYVEQLRSAAFILADEKETQITIGKTYRLEAKKAYFSHMGMVL